MAKRALTSDAIEHYVGGIITRETPVQKRLREETSRMPNAQMQIGADQGALFAMLVRLLNARRALEIGTFTGYSALVVADALPPDGKIVCCDKSEEWTSIAKRYWEEAGVSERIDLRLGPALDTLRSLITSGETGSFDFAFIDADKGNYDAYYESCLRLVRPGGVIALDNVLWSGAVTDESDQNVDTMALRAINAKIRDDSRVDSCLLTVGDGVMLVRKR